MVTAKVKTLFFDRKAVRRAMDRATRRALSLAGYAIMRTARESMPYRSGKKPSPAGRPPFAHKGHPRLRKLLFFSVDDSRRSVVIGPVKFEKGEAPSLNEDGGLVRRVKRVFRRAGRKAASKAQARAFLKKVRTGQVAKAPAATVTYTARYPERPFMGPAMKKEIPRLPSRWQNSVRRGQ